MYRVLYGWRDINPRSVLLVFASDECTGFTQRLLFGSKVAVCAFQCGRFVPQRDTHHHHQSTTKSNGCIYIMTQIDPHLFQVLLRIPYSLKGYSRLGILRIRRQNLLIVLWELKGFGGFCLPFLQTPTAFSSPSRRYQVGFFLIRANPVSKNRPFSPQNQRINATAPKVFYTRFCKLIF